MRGAYCETGIVLPLTAGDPRPVMPETLWRCELGTDWRAGLTDEAARDCSEGALGDSLRIKSLRAGSEGFEIDGGVSEPLVGVVPLLSLLAVSEVEASVLKLARDRRRSSLRLKSVGAIGHGSDANRSG